MATKITGMKKGTQYVLIGLLLVGVFFAVKHFVLDAPKAVGESKVLSSTGTNLADEAVTSPSLSQDKKFPIPDFDKPTGSGTELNLQGFEWNANMPLHYALGGKSTSKGSLFAKYNLNVHYVLQSDCSKTAQDFIKNTEDLKANPNTVPMVWYIMGNGGPGFSLSLASLDKLGDDGKYIIFDASGRSDGEDAFWGPAEWARNPQSCLGHGVAFVYKDGDQDIPVQWCKTNHIAMNFNQKTFDPNALNVIFASTYVEAGDKVIAGYTEDRTLVRNGKTVPDSVIKLKADSYSSWTPVDVTVAKKLGGLTRIASTNDYPSLMPSMYIINKKWAYAHRTDVENFIRALGEAGDQVRSFPEAAAFAAKVSALNYLPANPDKDQKYWLTYYNGAKEKDAQGQIVPLGGSKAFNLKDAANQFGLGDDKIDRFKITWETVTNTLQTYAPDDAKGIKKYSDVVDKSFLLSVLANSSDEGGSAEQIQYADKITQTVSNQSVSIEFDNASATIKPASYALLDKIFNDAVIGEGLKVSVVGHTNNVGNPASNKDLSLRRAQAVVDYLRKKGLSQNQLQTAQGVGDTDPIEGSDPADARNRRVEIITGH